MKDERKKYWWPASALTANSMKILYEQREKTGIPISVLLKEAVEEYGRRTDNETILHTK